MVCVLLMSFFNKHERKAGDFHFSFAGKCGWEREREGEKKIVVQFSTKILSKATNKNLWENVERVGQYTHRHTNMYISMKQSSI